MVFSSLTFLLWFLPCVLLVYFLVPKKAKNAILFAFSLLFYAWGEPIYVGLMIFSTVLDYCCGRAVEKYRGTPKTKIGLLVSVIVNLSLLCLFKYTDFLLGTVNGIFVCNIPLLNILTMLLNLPLILKDEFAFLVMVRGTGEFFWIVMGLYLYHYPLFLYLTTVKRAYLIRNIYQFW